MTGERSGTQRERAETIGARSVRQTLFNDLDEIEGLIRDVLVYAGSAHCSDERNAGLEIAAFLKRWADDYGNMGNDVVVLQPNGVILTRPRPLRRLLTNLVDNVLKFAGAAEIATEIEAEASVTSLCRTVVPECRMTNWPPC